MSWRWLPVSIWIRTGPVIVNDLLVQKCSLKSYTFVPYYLKKSDSFYFNEIKKEVGRALVFQFNIVVSLTCTICSLLIHPIVWVS